MHYSLAMNIAASTQKRTFLNSLLSEAAFGKAQGAFDLNENGLLAECRTAAGQLFSDKMTFSFRAFRFDGTEAEKQSGQVLFTGAGFGGRTLLAIMQADDQAQKARAVFAYAACVRQATIEGRSLPANGAGGVLYKETKNGAALLFLPQGIFEFAAHNAASEEYAKLQAVWQDKNLSGARAVSYVRAVLIYQALCGEFPFPAQDLEERQADILDARYLPLKNKINGVSAELSEQISYALEYGSAAFESKMQESGLSQKGSGDGQSIPGANGSSPKIEWLDKDFCLEELAAELGLAPDGSVHGVERKTSTSQKDFEEEARRLLQKKSVKAKASRSLRRNRALFIFGVFLIAISLFFGRSVRRDKLMRPTTISLSERETAELFFSGFHSTNTILMQESSKGKDASELIKSTANIHVSSKMRDAFSKTVGTVTPEIYVYRPDLSDKWIYGITNFALGSDSSNMKEADNRKSAPTLKQKPAALKVKNGQTALLNVSYYRVYNEGAQSDISVEKVLGTVSLTFAKNRWLVTGLDLKTQEAPCSIKEFLADREAALEAEQGDALLAARKLKEKYEWIPTDKEMAAARIECETRMRQE
ncbi:MAG: hypothetical protein J6V90_06545 [Treponema sp.]|nr:hypothetical protein [Treponema sp.]